MNKVVVVTTCTGRKSVRPSQAAHFRHVDRCGIDIALRNWFDRLAAESRAIRADHLYRGRAFAEARATAQRLTAPLKIISAGLGLIDARDVVPPYEATVSPVGHDAVL